MPSNKKGKYRTLGFSLSPEDLHLGERLVEKNGLQKVDIVRIGLVKLANEEYPEVTSWATYQLKAEALYAKHLAEEAQRENQRLKAELQSTKALIPNKPIKNSEVIDDTSLSNPEVLASNDISEYYHTKRKVHEVAY